LSNSRTTKNLLERINMKAVSVPSTNSILGHFPDWPYGNSYTNEGSQSILCIKMKEHQPPPLKKV